MRLKKLDSMAVHVGWPDKWQDYSGLDIDGLSYYEALKKIGKYNMDLAINLLGTALIKKCGPTTYVCWSAMLFTVIRIIP